MRYHITLSIQPDLLEKLDKLAKEQKKPRNRIIEELLTEDINNKKKGGKRK